MMKTITVFKDCVEGRLARLLWGYGKFTNVTLSLSDTKGPTVYKEEEEVLMKSWPDILEIAVIGSPAEDILVPSTNAMKSTMNSWIEYAAKRDFNMGCDSLEMLDKYLLNHTFLASNTVTMADLVVYISSHSFMLKSQPAERAALVNFVRWFDHIQHLPGIVNTWKDIPLVSVEKDMDLITAVMEKNTVKETPLKGKEAKAAAKAKKKEAKAEKPPVEERPIADITRLNIKVGQIKSVERHPEADRLYCLKIDVGEPELREICSGLVGYLEPEQILSQYVCILANMKPKSLRGKMSNGMVLCVSNEDHSKIELLKPAQGAMIGERVMMEGLSGEPDTVLSTKTGKDPFVAVQPDLICRDKKAYYKDHLFVTSKGPCSCETLLTGTVS